MPHWDDIFPPPTSTKDWRAYRRPLSYGIVLVFLLSIAIIALLGIGSGGRLGRHLGGIILHGEDGLAGPVGSSNPTPSLVDHSRYITLETISSSQLRLERPDHRLIVIGDIHGSIKPLKKLLDKVDYDSEKDTFVHVGDLLGKGPKPLDVLKLMRKYNVRGVRGNHDQPVLEIRSWLEHTFVNKKTGKVNLKSISLKQAEEAGFPEAWGKWKQEHFEIAKTMTKEDYAYLLSLPLKIHLPSIHTFVVHAGLLPSVPSSSSTSTYPVPHWKSPSLGRLESELSLLSDVEPNMDPWVLLNVRSILPDGTLTQSAKKGEPWSTSWNKEMNAAKKTKGKAGWPSTVVYGHAAGRGLDVHPWSIGLDSGCVYGKQLTALVLGSGLENKKSPKAVRKGKDVQVGEWTGKLVQVDCESLD